MRTATAAAIVAFIMYALPPVVMAVAGFAFAVFTAVFIVLSVYLAAPVTVEAQWPPSDAEIESAINTGWEGDLDRIMDRCAAAVGGENKAFFYGLVVLRRASVDGGGIHSTGPRRARGGRCQAPLRRPFVSGRWTGTATG